MTEYYVFLAIVMMFAAAYSKNSQFKITLYATLAVMVLFAGLRSAGVGTDSGSYARSFTDIGVIEGDWKEQLTDEPGFYYLKLVLSMVSNQYWVLFTGIAILTYSCVVIAIKRETEKIVIPLFVFITLGLYTFVFNAARQGIAVAIYMLSFKFLFQNHKTGFLKYCLFVFLAAMFHKTVVIALPLYFLFRQKYSPKMLVIIAVLGIGMGAALPTFLAFAGTHEARYELYSTQASGGEMLTVFYMLITAFFIIRRKKIDLEYLPKYDVFLSMMLFGTLIFMVVQVNNMYVELTRFAAYFQVASVFLWAYIYQSKTKPFAVFSVVIIVGHLLYFYIFCTRMAGLVPYSFNPTIF